MDREKRNAYMRQWGARTYPERRAKGLCRCGKPAVPGGSQCATHLERARQRAAVNRAAGMCACGRPRHGDSMSCKSCLESNRKSKGARGYRTTDRKAHRKRAYGLSDDDYTTLLFDRQLYCCAVYWKPFSGDAPPVIDHDHFLEATGVPTRNCVRGIVHNRCNALVAAVENNSWTGKSGGYRELLNVGRYLARGHAFPK